MVPLQPLTLHPRGGYLISYVKNHYLCPISAVVQAAQNTGSINNVGSGAAAAPSSTAFTTFTSVGTFTTGGKTETGTFTVTGSRAAQGTGGPGSSGQSSGASSKSNTAAIAGGAVGGIVILALLAAFILLFLRRRRRIRTEMDVTNHMTVPNPDLFRPAPGTGWDIESNRTSAVSAASSTSSGGPFVKPMTQTGPRLNVTKKPVPGLQPKLPSVSVDPFWDPSQARQFEQVPITPVQVEVKVEKTQTMDPVVATHADPFADPEKKAEPKVEKPAQDPFVDPAPAVPHHMTPHSDGPSRLSTVSSQFDPSVRQSSTPVSSFFMPVNHESNHTSLVRYRNVMHRLTMFLIHACFGCCRGLD